ncbi:MAG: hypothetical protein WKF43_07550 [Acidimicrobiales bacterium]
MNVDLGDADAGVAVATWVIDDYMQELYAIGGIKNSYALTRIVGGVTFNVTVLPDAPRFEMVKPPASAAPYTRLLLTGTIEIRRASTPNAPPTVLPLEAKVKLAPVLLPGDPVPVVGFAYQGADGTPTAPVTPADLDELFAGDDIKKVLDSSTIPLAKPLVLGLNAARFPPPLVPPDPATWSVTLQLMPGVEGTDDSFGCFVGPPGTTAIPLALDSFVPPQTGLATTYNRTFLDLMLTVGAKEKEGTKVDDAKIKKPLLMHMTDDAIFIKGGAVREVWGPLPDVDLTFKGPILPILVRGTTVMSTDTRGVVVDVDDSDEVFYSVAKWFLTIVAGVLLLSGFGAGALIGIGLWLTLVQGFWSADVDIENADNTVRGSLAAALGAELTVLAEGLDVDTTVGQLRIETTPDRLEIHGGNMVLLALILVKPLTAKLHSGEYSRKLRRFGIFELDDGRRFRAQELARLMAAGKITVPGFHQVNSDYIRANPDDAEANNLLRRFKANRTDEVVLRNTRRN